MFFNCIYVSLFIMLYLFSPRATSLINSSASADLLNLSNPEKSVVSAGKLFHVLTIRTLKKLRLLELKYRCLCNIVRDRVIVTGFLE